MRHSYLKYGKSLYNVVIYEGQEEYEMKEGGIKMLYDADFVFVQRWDKYVIVKNRRSTDDTANEILKQTLQYEYESVILDKVW